MTRRGMIAIDGLMLAFAAVMALAVLVRVGRDAATPFLLGALALTGLLAWLMTRAPDDTPFMNFAGPSYPLLLAVVFYTAVGILNEAAGRNYDVWAQHADIALFGEPISITWHQRMPGALWSWILHLCYVSYYPVVLTAGLWHWRARPRPVYERACFTIALAFFVSYAVFAWFPVTGPRYFYGVATGPAAETWAARLVHRVLEGGSAYGTAFPSSHIAATWTAVLVTWRSSRPLALALALPALGLALGTVYGQFHYAIDALAGVALVLVVMLAAEPLRRSVEARIRPAARQPA